jgi:HK97 gp10 family phage protein
VGKVTIKGLAELERKLKALPEVVERATKRAIHAEVNEVAQDLRRHAPVDEGDLVRSIQEEIDEDGLGGRAVITAEHAEYVVHGTSDTPANDFVTPAEARARQRFPDRVHDAVLVELRKL